MTTDNFDIAPLLLLPLGRFYLNVNARTNLREGDLTAALRSRLGEILKGRFCTCMDFRKAACPGCVRETSCLYLQLFAPTPACLDAACLGEGRRPPTHPARPYMLRALGPGKDDRIPTGKRGRVELTLLGERAIACARPMLESVLHAAASLTPSAVEAGTPRSDAPVLEVLGWEAEVPQKTRGAWEIAVMEESVIARQVPSAPLEEWLRALPGQTALDQESQRLGVCFETPVQSRRFERGITFPDLLKGIMARLRDLKGIYHPDCDMASLPPEFFKLAGQVKNTGRLERCRRRRPYPAQDKVMDLGGWSGSLTFTGPISPFLPLLKAGTLVGVGRKLTYGLGRFSLF